jgi:aspartate 1-decarboxylase
MQSKFLAGKLHGIQVTETKLHYHGSITPDLDFIEAAGMRPLEFVCIWNKANGNRFETYVLPGERGSGVCCLNGAAAHLVTEGDEVIVASYRYVERDAIHKPIAANVVIFGKRNTIERVIEQEVNVATGEFRETERVPRSQPSRHVEALNVS